MASRNVRLAMFLLLLAYYAGAQEVAPPQRVNYCDLVEAPQSFAGKRIRVRAIYRYGFEIQRLDPPNCCPAKAAKIWVELGTLDRRSRRLARRFPKGMGLALGVFAGVFDSGGLYGDGGYRLELTVDRVEVVEATAHPSPTFPPNWVPCNCDAESEKVRPAER